MSISEIPANFLDRTGTIERSTKIMSAQGSPTDTWNVIVSNVGGTVQPVKMEELKDLPQGKEFNVTHKAYLTYSGSLTILPGDHFTDSIDGVTYNVISVQRYKSARLTITAGHHYKLYLEDPQATRS